VVLTTVEIDERKFGRRKYHRGHPVKGQWVFGGVERESGATFLVPVKDRTADTLMVIIRDWVEPGTTAISDCWGAYRDLGAQGYTHQTVNHSMHFVDPNTGAHQYHREHVAESQGFPRAVQPRG
jgi:transposase-like protein